MKKLLVGTATVAIILGAAWYAGETWLSGFAREIVAENPSIEAETVAPLRNPTRMGLHLAGIEIGDAENGATAPDLDVFVPFHAPTRAVMDLPRQMELRINGEPMALSMVSGRALAAIAPLNELALSRVAVDAQAVALDGFEMLEALDIDARLAHMGAAAPPDARAAYTITLGATGIVMPQPVDRLDINGPVQVWLTEIPGKPMLEGRVPPPELAAVQTPGISFTLGGRIEARLIGRIQADAEGFAEGETAVYTSDADALIEAAIQAGLIPQEAAMAVGTLLKNLAEARVAADGPAAGAETARDEAASPAGQQAMLLDQPEGGIATPDADLVVSLPPARKGEIRLPLSFRNGKMRLGIVPIGPAPRLTGRSDDMAAAPS